MELDARKKAILEAVIEEYCQTFEPVGSKLLVSKYFPEISSATIRHELAMLAEEGFLEAPHTSAGRIPTQAGYEYYVKQMDFTQRGSKKEIPVPKNASDREARKQLAKWLSKELSLCVVWIHDRGDHFYTGVSALLSKPDFADPNLLYNISAIIDEFDDRLSQLYPALTNEIVTLIGSRNPVSEFCTAMGLALPGSGGLLLLSPMRTQYKKNYAMLLAIKELWPL